MILVSLYDVKADSYSQPHPVYNEETAKRELSMLVNADDKSILSQHPEDYILFAVGEWCDRVPVGDNSRMTARLVAYPELRSICKAIDLKTKE